MITALYIPSSTELAEAAALAARHGMALYTDGERSVIARRKPTLGTWAEVVLRSPAATPEGLPCAA